VSDVGLSQFHGVNALCGCHDRDQLCRCRGSFCRLSLPAIVPPGRHAPSLLSFFLVVGARNLTTQVADESHSQREELTGLIGQGKREAGLGHLADELTFAVVGQWEKGPDIREGLQPRILIGSQDGDHRMSCLSQISQERCGHAFSVDDDACVCRFPARLFIASQHVRQSRRQMLVSTRGRGQARMPLLIM
jgi:hypothetical protein